jgi:[acyl-carrier-protein] S-malonyltransferase
MREQDVDTFYELGIGRVLSGLVRRIDRDLRGVSVGTPAEIETTLKSV